MNISRRRGPDKDLVVFLTECCSKQHNPKAEGCQRLLCVVLLPLYPCAAWALPAQDVAVVMIHVCHSPSRAWFAKGPLLWLLFSWQLELCRVY